MKLRLTAMILLSLCLSQAFADEGMWLLGNLRKNKQAERVMKELGLQMPVNKLYNPKKPALANAVVSFGGFCSGVVVSEDGLVFTNHHCGFDAIRQHSTVKHDYLRNGFVADSLSDELPNPDLFVSFLVRTEDVTERILQALPQDVTEDNRSLIVDSLSTLIADEAVKNDTLLRAVVSSFYAGNEYYLSVYKDYYDVRLVYAPLRLASLGEIPITGFGRGIPETFPFFVSMRILITNRQLILKIMFLIILIIMLLFPWQVIRKVLFV